MRIWDQRRTGRQPRKQIGRWLAGLMDRAGTATTPGWVPQAADKLTGLSWRKRPKPDIPGGPFVAERPTHRATMAQQIAKPPG